MLGAWEQERKIKTMLRSYSVGGYAPVHSRSYIPLQRARESAPDLNLGVGDCYTIYDAVGGSKTFEVTEEESMAGPNEYISMIVARYGLSEEQAILLHELIGHSNWMERVVLNLVASNMVAAEGEGLEVSLDALGF